MRINSFHLDGAGVLRGLGPRSYLSSIATPPGAPPVRVAGRQMEAGICLALGSHAPFDLFLPTGGGVFILSVSATASGLTRTHLPPRGAARFHLPGPRHAAVLTRFMAVIARLRSSRDRPSAVVQIAGGMRDLLVTDVLRTLTESTLLTPEPDELAPRSSAVLRACTYIEMHLHESLTLNDLCAAVGVRARTLEYGFADLYDIRPMQYVKCVRLHRVHRDLLMARDSVSETPRRWSFSHMGQFSRDYRLAYGESPSDTLARGRRPLKHACTR